jgi:hypothetical protein
MTGAADSVGGRQMDPFYPFPAVVVHGRSEESANGRNGRALAESLAL